MARPVRYQEPNDNLSSALAHDVALRNVEGDFVVNDFKQLLNPQEQAIVDNNDNNHFSLEEKAEIMRIALRKFHKALANNVVLDQEVYDRILNFGSQVKRVFVQYVLQDNDEDMELFRPIFIDFRDSDSIDYEGLVAQLGELNEEGGIQPRDHLQLVGGHQMQMQ
jgi:hypothetical protein